jgi:iron complex transport system substrate-binding protein
VATVRYADYPAAARQLPQVGDAHALDLERIAALKPDLLVVWLHGSSERQMEQLRALRIPIFHSEPKRLEQIGDSLRRLGVLAGQEPAAHAAATQFDKTLAALRTQFAGRSPLRVFYQVWHQPLMTVNRAHLINEVISLCGGVNVFAAQNVLVPVLSVESVLAARPQVLVTASGDGRPDDALAPWQAFKTFEPIARGQVIWLPADLISRATPRVLEGADQLCRVLDAIRAHPTGH